METFMFNTLPIETEKMITQIVDTKRNKKRLCHQINNMRRQFYADQWREAHFPPGEWTEEFETLEQDFNRRMNENFFNNFIEPCRRRLTVGGDIEYWDWQHPTGDHFCDVFRGMLRDTPTLDHCLYMTANEPSKNYTHDAYHTDGDWEGLVPLEDCIFH